ncbi:flagellar basal body P-ring formation chaperone FlgA [Hoeflea sp.]|uniref:flagellar basal body P-ring formation chaperone FlgA n=1 Tax=Hoeflea sp. TaxID=1940281 RepID=UPI003B522593
MTFSHSSPGFRFRRCVLALAGLFCLTAAAHSGMGTAVVPERTIYPGEELHSGIVREVEVTNPNLKPGYVSVTSELLGKVTTRTLLPGRTIPMGALRDAWAVERGKTVALVFSGNGLTITAVGTPLQNAAIGDFIRVRNIESGVVVSGTVMGDGTVQVAPK